MPFGFPSATIATRDIYAVLPITCAKHIVKEGEHLAILGQAAEQDGARQGEILCRTTKGVEVMIPQAAIRL